MIKWVAVIVLVFVMLNAAVCGGIGAWRGNWDQAVFSLLLLCVTYWAITEVCDR